MLATVQRVSEASVIINDLELSSIKKGVLIFLCVEQHDTSKTVKEMINKIYNFKMLDGSKGITSSSLKNQNEDNGLCFGADDAKVIFISPMKDQGNDGLHQAVLRVSEELREGIKANGNRIFLGSSSCPVYDRFFVKRCNRCQGFHHFHKDCKKNQICGNCAGKHDTRQCQEDNIIYKCINCSIGGFANTDHMASSYDCPAYIAEQDKLKKSIHYYSKNSEN